MKEEIEKILTFRLDIRQSDFSLGNDQLAAQDLQKLFLSKQIELLEGMRESPHGVKYELPKQITKLKFELKQLQA